MLRRTLVTRLMDDPGVWGYQMLHLHDELLLNDWKSPSFDPYKGCDDPWSPEQGFVRGFHVKGREKRVYGQFAMKAKGGSVYQWQPAILHTGVPGVYLCQKTLRSLGIPFPSARSRFPQELCAMIGNYSCGVVRMTEDELSAHDENNVSGDVNILGVDFLGVDLLTVMKQAVEERIGRPTPEEVWVSDGSAVFRVTPKHHDAASLKDAIKVTAPSTVTCDAFQLTVIDPSGTVLGGKDLLVAGVQYTYKLPKHLSKN